MAIVKMNKFILLLFESHKERLLEVLQGFEGVQFINLQNEDIVENYEDLKGLSKDEVGEKYKLYEENLSKIRFALDFLQTYAPQKSTFLSLLEDKKEISLSQLTAVMESNSWNDVYDELKKKEVILNDLHNQKTKLEGEICALLNWTNFDAPLKSLRELNFSIPFLGTTSKQYEDILVRDFNKQIMNGCVEILNRDNQDIYIFALVHHSEEEKAQELLKKFGFSTFSQSYEASPFEIIESYNSKIKQLIIKEKEIKESIKNFDGEREHLLVAYEYFNNLILKLNASNNFLKSEKVITICGWNPVENNKELEALVKKSIGNEYYIAFNKVDEEEASQVPIKLINNSFSTPFESILEMYSMPLYTEVDPTPILAVFYFMFYGMMLSDAGYGLIMIAVSAFALSKVNNKERRNIFKLFMFAGISTMFWGALYGGWFGDLFNYFGFNPPKLLDTTTDIAQIFILSLIFGVFHIFIGLGIKGYILIKSGNMKDAIYDVLTWYLTLIGSILMLMRVGGKIGTVLFVVGIVGLLLTQGRSSPTLGGKIGGGIYGVYGITGYLGDIVSYSRLLALGLATGFIANALNLIINLFPSPIKYVLAPVLFLGLHTFNLVINALGSYVHAARLQYLEFFSKFYEGGGKKFTPFKLSDKYIKIIK
ncbi:V-type ATP synthase subunit I [Clostridium polyendosporum]|uniref:V-type ATP synthase subunit I n=1 Tax=Clostridium polyendosporum TaxID=69208 RepID=A0A919VEU3_9CLOT|nr:V-type ATP synthase subunit I [Clostridium polyendosporum]GIM29549.1 V-type ATP synthase subunit I [Clostridium polyendosporum]